MSRRVLLAVAAVVLAVVPFYADTSLLQMGLFVCAATIGAIGLNLLSGVAGQLSLGHAFFLAVGAYGYVALAGTDDRIGLGLPTWLAAVLAPALAGLAGLAFSPISSRLRGLYLGVATLALVYIGQHVLYSATDLTGGYDGRPTPRLSLFGLKFGDDSGITVFNVPLGQYELLWYLGVVLAALAWWFARGVVAGRPGRGLQAVRDGEVPAAVMGVAVRRAKTSAFVLSSVYAGVAGVLYALIVGRVVPDSFGLTMSIDYLAMAVLGGMGVVGGSVVGAAIVTGLPLLLGRYVDALPLLAEPGSGGVDPSSFARYLYGALVIVLMIFEPDGLAAVARRVRALLPAPPAVRTHPSTTPHPRGGRP
ncbi:branched-chain amino acid ABC transporter permease [Actinomadura violacea]|nr:branched-chain amino acid ABC transporter permease [Actinomadura violacea]